MKKLLFFLIIIPLFSCEKEKLIRTEPVYRIASDTNNAAWFQAEAGLTRFNGALWNNFDLSSQGIALKEIRGFYTKGNDFYIYTNSGYVHYNVSGDPGQPLEKVNKASANFFNDTILSILVTDRTWILNGNGISFLKNNQWVHQHDTLITDFAISNDTCYVARSGYGVNRYIYTADGFTGASYYSYGYGCLINDTVYAIHITKNGNQWYGTQDGVFNHPESTYQSQWIQYTTANGLPYRKVHLLTEDSEGRIWAGTESGVAFFDGAAWTSYITDHVKSIIADKAGNVWITSENGLVKYDGAFKALTTADGLSDNHVNCVIASPDGSVWIGTQNGATHYKDGKFTVYRSITQN